MGWNSRVGLGFFALTILACGGGGTASADPTFGEAYFPRTQDSVPMFWKYRKTYSDGANINADVWYVGEDVFNDQATHAFEEAEDGAPNVVRQYKIKDGIQLLGNSVGGAESHTNAHLMVFDMTPGSSANYSDSVTGATSGINQYKFERLPDEVVTVPAGSFKCAKFTQTTTGVGGSLPLAIGNVKTMWFAPNVGLVKLTDNGSLDVKNDLTTELLSYGTLSI